MKAIKYKIKVLFLIIKDITSLIEQAAMSWSMVQEIVKCLDLHYKCNICCPI